MQQATQTLSDTDIQSLELATLDAVAPPQTEAMDGWLLPFDRSTIGRAKSAVPVRHNKLDATTLGAIAARYAAHGLDAAFRIPDLPALAGLHDALHTMGFEPKQPTLVQVGTVDGVLALAGGLPAHVFDTPVAQWAAVYVAAGFDPVDGAHRVQALSRSPVVAYAVVLDAGDPVAAGTVSCSQGWAGIHGVRTVIHQRGRGLALRVLQGLVLHARGQGLERLYLQVEEGNGAALSLYQRAGFRTVWRYHYWRRAADTSGC
jgi:RimJ/RimL family protein N-acetyltransferase